RRGQDVFYRTIRNEFTGALKLLKIVDSAPTANSKVDRMWERLLELVLFYRSKNHRKPVDILKSFISGTRTPTKRLSSGEIGELRRIFQFVRDAYKKTNLGKSRLATDQTHFYTMMTTLIKNSLVKEDQVELMNKLAALGEVLDGKTPRRRLFVTTLRDLRKNRRNKPRTHREGLRETAFF